MARRGEAAKRHEARETGSNTGTKLASLSMVVGDAKKLELRVVHARLSKPQTIEFSEWKRFPGLAKAIADATLRVVARQPSYRSREQFVQDLRYGFYEFMVQFGKNVTCTLDLDTSLFNLFVSKLGRKKKDGTFLYSSDTRLKRLGALRAIVAEMKVQAVKLPEDCFVPNNPWPKGASNRYKTKPIAIPEYVRFINHCARDVTAISSDISKLRASLKVGRKTIRESQDFEPSSLAECLAWLEWRFDGLLPERQEILANWPDVFDLVESWGGHSYISRALHPSIADLAPFFFCLASDTVYNSQPLAELKLSDIERYELAGEHKIQLSPFKTRAGKRQRRVFPVDDSDPTNPASIETFLLEWTSGIRRIADIRWRNNLFLYVKRNNFEGIRIRPLMDPETRSMRDFDTSTRKYCQRSGFAAIGTRITRVTGVAIGRLDLGFTPIEILALTGQSRVDTLEKNYRDASADRANEEAIADVMNTRFAYVATNGSIDPRKHGSTASLAATPGWSCVNPYDSPMPTETKGRRCQAVGKCPACPLAFMDVAKPASYLRAIQLKDKLEERKHQIGMHLWELRWSATYRALVTVYIPAFRDPTIVDLASRMSIGPFPDVE